MDLEAAYRTDQYYRLDELAKDETIGGLVKHLIGCNRIHEELARVIMSDPDPIKARAAALKFMYAKYRWYLDDKKERGL